MIIVKPYTAQGAIPKFRFVKIGASASQVQLAVAASDRILGVYIGPDDAADGEAIEVCHLGESWLTVGGTIGIGMSLTTDANGQGVNAAPVAGANNKTGAIALQAGGSGGILLVIVVPGWYQG